MDIDTDNHGKCQVSAHIDYDVIFILGDPPYSHCCRHRYPPCLPRRPPPPAPPRLRFPPPWARRPACQPPTVGYGKHVLLFLF